MKNQLDQILKRYVSRKLMVFVVASFGLFSGTLGSSDWVIIAAVYIGTQGVIDAISKMKQLN
tara:strand:- start:1159 stop:1344 length:186 start_codon:yes stop_codon:yes gene_type:complete